MKKKIMIVLMALMSLSMILSSFAHAQAGNQVGACSEWSRAIDENHRVKLEALEAKQKNTILMADVKKLEAEKAQLENETKKEWDSHAASCGE